MEFNNLQFGLDLTRLSTREFWDKYNETIPEHVKIADIISALQCAEKERELIDKGWEPVDTKRHPFYLLDTGTQYEVFEEERGGRHGLEAFDTLEPALFFKLDLIMNSLMHGAPDSMINRKK